MSWLTTSATGVPARIRLTGSSSFFPVSVRGIAGHARRSCQARGAARARSRSVALHARLELAVQLDARAQHDEQDELVRLLEVDDEAVEHVVELLDHGVELARAEPDAAAVEGRVGAAGDHRAAALGEHDPVAEAPEAREVVEVRRAVAGIAGVVPEAHRHRRHRLADDELAELADDRLAVGRRTPPRRRRGSAPTSRPHRPAAAGCPGRSPCRCRCRRCRG